jgi:hypothetical protein
VMAGESDAAVVLVGTRRDAGFAHRFRPQFVLRRPVDEKPSKEFLCVDPTGLAMR